MPRHTASYKARPLSFADVMAVRSLLTNFFPNQNERETYRLKYGYTETEFTRFADVKKHWKEHGAPDAYYERRINSDGRETVFDGIADPNVFKISANSDYMKPKETVEDVEFCLQLQYPDGSAVPQPVNTAFIAVRFTDEGKAIAAELTRLLKEVGIEAYTGEEFTGDSIPEKVKRLIEEKHVFIGIFVSEEAAWVHSECVYAASIKKEPIIMVQDDAKFVPGILGQDRELIHYPKGQIMGEVYKVLHKIKTMRGA